MRFQISLFPKPKNKPDRKASSGLRADNAVGLSARMAAISINAVMRDRSAVQTNFGSKLIVGSAAFFSSHGIRVLRITPKKSPITNNSSGMIKVSTHFHL